MLTPRPKYGQPQPSALGDFQLPTAEGGRCIPIVYGTAKITGGNCTWWGDLKVDPISQTQGGALGIGGQNVVTGYKYSLGMQYVLCYGAWSGGADGNPANRVEFISLVADDKLVPCTATELSEGTEPLAIGVNQPDFFGGDAQEGGLLGTIAFYRGTDHRAATANVQPPDVYLAAQQGRNVPAYRGICHAVFGQMGGGTGASGNNYVWLNNDFELGGSPPQYWTTLLAGCTWAYETASPFAGSRSLKITGGSGAGSPGMQYDLVLPVIAGDVFRASFAGKGSPANPAELILQFFGDTAPYPFISQEIVVQSSTTWGTASKDVTIPAGAGLMKIIVAANNNSSPCWFDAVDVHKIVGSTLGGSYPFYIGTTSYVKTIGFIVKRCPNPFGYRTEHDIAGDANPALVIYDLLTHPIYGLRKTDSIIDLASFDVAARTLAAEALGVSMNIDTPASADELISEVLRHADGVLYNDPQTGLYTLKLARADYDPATLPELTIDDILEPPDYSRGSWSETTNEVKITFTDRDSNYMQNVSPPAQDTANIAVLGTVNSETIDFKGISNMFTATLIAARALRTLSYPLAKLTIKARRSAWKYRPGGCFRLTWAPLGIENEVFRIGRINYGKIDAGEITIDAVEDIFGLSTLAFTPPTTSGWNDPSGVPSPPTSPIIVEHPFATLPTTNPNDQIGVGIVRADRRTAGVHVWTDSGSGYEKTNESTSAIVPSGRLLSDYSRTTPATDASGFMLGGGTDLDMLLGTTPAGLLAGDCLLRFEDTGELCAFQTATPNGDGGATYTIGNVVRGVYDTLPADHVAGTRVSILRDAGRSFLSSYASTPVAPISPVVGNFVDAEIPSGVIDGVNQTFRLARSPVAGSVKVYRNGVRISPTGYTVSSSGQIAMTSATSQLQVGDDLYVDYRY